MDLSTLPCHRVNRYERYSVFDNLKRICQADIELRPTGHSRNFTTRRDLHILRAVKYNVGKN